LPSDKPLIGFFGRFMAQKGFRDVVDAMRLVVERVGEAATPLVVTFGWGAFIREDYQYIEQQGLSSHFKQLPGTDDMPGSLKGVDLVVMPSRWEACGLLAMEALAAGVPIIGTGCVGLDEVLSGTPADKIAPYSPEQLAEAIVKNRETPRKDAFRAYQATACERFAIERPAQALRALYDQIAQQRY
jgi:glycosyltransferase involved in cell wall biosynthesis